MVLIYIDESGSPDYKDSENLYALTAILIKEPNYKEINITLNKFKEECRIKYNINENFEIHIKYLLGNPVNDNLKDFKNISWDDRKTIFEKIYETLSKLDFKIISIVILKDQLNNPLDLRLWANSLLLERIQMHNQDLNYNKYGIIFQDREQERWNVKKLNILRKAIYSAPIIAQSFIAIDKIIPMIYFLDSRESIGVQIADCICFCVRRFLRNLFYNLSASIEILNINAFHLIKYRFHKYPDCFRKGLKIFPLTIENKEKIMKELKR